MRNIVAKEATEAGYTIQKHKSLNRQDHKLRVQRGVHPLLSANMLVCADFQHGIIDQREYNRRQEIIGAKIRKAGGLLGLRASRRAKMSELRFPEPLKRYKFPAGLTRKRTR